MPVIEKDACDNCGKCAEICPAKALTIFGEYKTVEEILNRVVEDKAFYNRSQGGITLSGGEVLLQPDFARSLLTKAKKSGLQTAIETTCFARWESVVKVIPLVDFLFIDLKSVDREKHKVFTGVDPMLIWNNVERICKEFPDSHITFRTPVIPGFNDSVADIQKIVDLIISFKPNMKVIDYELLPYHALGLNKYEYLNMNYALKDEPNMKKEHVQEIIDRVAAPFHVFVT